MPRVWYRVPKSLKVWILALNTSEEAFLAYEFGPFADSLRLRLILRRKSCHKAPGSIGMDAQNLPYCLAVI